MEKSFEFVDVHSVVWQCIGDSLTTATAPSSAVRPMMLLKGCHREFYVGKTNSKEGDLKAKVLFLQPPNLGKTIILSVLL